MNEMFRQSLFAGVTISLIAYEIGLFLKRKLGLAILNPLLVSIVIVITTVMTSIGSNNGCKTFHESINPAAAGINITGMISIRKNAASLT